MAYMMVTSGRLRGYAEDLRGLNAGLMNALEELRTTEHTLKGMWEGEANEAFHAAFLHDQGRMEAFHGAIEQYVQALLVIAAKYEEAEAHNLSCASTRTYG